MIRPFQMKTWTISVNNGYLLVNDISVAKHVSFVAKYSDNSVVVKIIGVDLMFKMSIEIDESGVEYFKSQPISNKYYKIDDVSYVLIVNPRVLINTDENFIALASVEQFSANQFIPAMNNDANIISAVSMLTNRNISCIFVLNRDSNGRRKLTQITAYPDTIDQLWVYEHCGRFYVYFRNKNAIYRVVSYNGCRITCRARNIRCAQFPKSINYFDNLEFGQCLLSSPKTDVIFNYQNHLF